MVVRTAGAGLRRLADVAVMQATDLGNLHDPARLGELDRPEVWSILVEREMGTRPVVVGEVPGRMRQRCRSPRTSTWFRHSRRIGPMSRSANGFCQRLCGAVAADR
jgi:hypothetical protein